MTVQWTPQRRLAAGITVLAILVIAVLAITRSRGAEEAAQSETDVAVHVASITRATLHRYVTAYGYVESRPALPGHPPGGALLSPMSGGVLAAIECTDGQRVQRGDVLFRLDSRLAAVAVQKAQRDLAFAEETFKRQQALLPTNGTSERAYQEAQRQLDLARADLATAETERAYLVITAPMSGTVVRVRAEIGQYVDPSAVLAELVDFSRLVVSARVPTGELAGVAVGQPVIVGTDTVAAGTVLVVGRDVDPATGTRLVQVSLPPDTGFRPGQFTDVRIVAERHADVLVVPDVALVTRAGEGTWVVATRGDSASRLPVTVGLRDAGLVEVSGDGVAEGLTIVSDDAYSLPPVARVRIVGG